MITLAKHMSAISIWPRFTNIMKTLVPLKLERVGSAPASSSFSHATLLLPAEAWNKRLKSAWNELVEVIYDQQQSYVNLLSLHLSTSGMRLGASDCQTEAAAH